MFSLLMPTRNRRQFLPEAIHAVQEQTYQVWELLISPWGDDVSDLIPDDPRIRVIPRASENLSDTLNTMVAQATGDIMNVCADDDLIDSTALSAVAAFSRLNVHKWIVGRLQGHGMPQCTYEQMLHANTLSCPAVYWTRAAGEATGLFDPAHELCFDYDYWLRMWKQNGPPMFIPYVLAEYRLHSDQLTNTRAEDVRADAEAVRRDHK